MIKKIVFTNKFSQKITMDHLSFTTYQNGEWDRLYIGSATETNSKVFETNIIKVTRSRDVDSGYVYHFFTKGEFIYLGENITVEFKTPVKVLKSIFCNVSYSSSSGIYANIYDENNNIIYTSTYPLRSGHHLTPELEKMKVYPTNTVGTIVTNDTSHISDVYSISHVTTDETTEDAITDIKYAVSFDGRKTYRVYKNSAWSALSLSNIMTNGMSKTELEALTDSEYDPQLTSDRTFDIVAGMNTNNSEKSPSIKSIIIDYLKISNM